MKSLRAVIIALLVCVLIPLGCGKRQGERQSGKVTITFWHSFVASTVPAFQHLVEQFEKEHPDIHIQAQYVPTGDALVQKLITAIQSHTAPDIAWIHSDFLDKLVQADAIYPMDQFIHGSYSIGQAEMDDFFPPLLQAARWQGKLYAIPMEATSLALFYNKRLFREAGLNPDHPPADWKELESYTRKLTRDIDGDGKTDEYGVFVPVFPASGDLNIWMNLQWTPFLWQAGGQEIDSTQTHLLVNSNAGVEALQLWKRLYDEMHFNAFSMAHDLGFASQHLAMVMDGPWDLPRYRQVKDFDWAVAPLPAGPAGRATYLAGEHLALFRQSRHPAEAWKFIKWIVEPRIQATFSIESGYLPVRRSVLSQPEYVTYLQKDPALKAFVDQMQWGRARAQIKKHRIEINRHIAEAIERSTLGGQDPKIMLDETVKKCDLLLNSGK